MKSLIFVSLLLALPVSVLATPPQTQKATEIARDYKQALASYGPASPEVCVAIACAYNMSLDADTNNTDFFLDMMAARCRDYYQGGEKEVHFLRLLAQEGRVMKLHRRLTEM